jgi:hypothetical protein
VRSCVHVLKIVVVPCTMLLCRNARCCGVGRDREGTLSSAAKVMSEGLGAVDEVVVNVGWWKVRSPSPITAITLAV